MALRPISFHPFELSQAAEYALLWTAACGQSLALTPRFFQHNLQPSPAIPLFTQTAAQGRRPVGFVVASRVQRPELTGVGWVEALAVAPHARRQGIGAHLLAAAEDWLAAQGCERIFFGGGWRHFAPGLPVELPTADFLLKRGYAGDGVEWDVARTLHDYASPIPPLAEVNVSPATPDDVAPLLAFLAREFPGRWQFECQAHFAAGGAPDDYIVLRAGSGVDGFCRLIPDNHPDIERYYPRPLPRPWGQLGSVGVSAACRGKGYGAAVVDAGLRRLQTLGVRGCVIDWTGLLGFYGKFGFATHRQYCILQKEMDDGR